MVYYWPHLTVQSAGNAVAMAFLAKMYQEAVAQSNKSTL